MVKRIIALLHTETSGLHEAAFLLGFFALGAKLLAIVRDRFLAETFGASLNLDIYYAAFRIPDFIYISFASLVASAVLIPFIIERLNNKEEARRFFNNIFTLFFFTILFVSGMAFLFMPTLSSLAIPGFGNEAQDTLVFLSRIMLLSPILLGLSGLFASITQSLQRFFVYALAPVLYNVGILFGVVFLYPFMGISGLAYGVVAGSLLHVAVQLPVLFSNGFLPRLTFRIDWKEIMDVLFLSFPRTLTLSAHHFTLLVLTALASFMSEGSITVFNLAFNLQSVPLSIIGISYSVAAFPTLTRLFSSGDLNAFVSSITTAARHIIFWSFPVLVLFVVLRAQIVRTVLGTGEFDWADTRLTAAALALFVLSTISQSLMLLFVRGYYATGRTLKPFLINVASLVFILISAYILKISFESFPFFQFFLESLFRIEDLGGSEVLVLPLAFSLGVFINILVLWGFFKKDFSVPTEEVSRTLRQSFLASVAMGFVAHQFLDVFDNIFNLNTFVGIFLQGLCSGLLGIMAGVAILKLLGNEEMRDVERTFAHKFWKSKPIFPDQEAV